MRIGPFIPANSSITWPRFGDRHRATNLYELERGDLIVIKSQYHTGHTVDGVLETERTTYELAKVRSIKGHGGRRVNGLCVDDYTPDRRSDCVDVITVEHFKGGQPRRKSYLIGNVLSRSVPQGYQQRTIEFDMLDREGNPLETLSRKRPGLSRRKKKARAEGDPETLDVEGMQRLVKSLFSRERMDAVAQDTQESWSKPHVARLFLKFWDFVQMEGRPPERKKPPEPEEPPSRFSFSLN